MDTYILGVDLGTSSLKAVLYDQDLRPLATEKQFYCEKGREVAGGDWWQAFLRALRRLGAERPLLRVACVSLSGYNAMLGVDRELEPVTPVILYYDSAPLRHSSERMGPEDAAFVFHKTGNRLFANGMMAPALKWLRETTGCYERADCFLYSNGYLAAKLTGSRTMDATRASLSLLHNPMGGELAWEPELCALFGVDRGKLPDILAPWESTGALTPAAARETGLPQGIPVLAGCMDSMCAALGSGITKAGQVLDIGGSAGGLAVTSGHPTGNRSLYLVRYILPDFWCNIGPLDAGARLFPWFVEQFTPGWTVPEYFERIGKVPPLSHGVQFLPYVGSARHPYWRTGLYGHFLNLSAGSTLQDMARAVMEGVACAHRRVLDDFISIGVQPSAITAAGGDSASEDWIQSKANFMRLPYLISQAPERSARGCAILGARHLGILKDFSPASPEQDTRVVRPQAELLDAYARYYRAFLDSCGLLYAEGI